MNPNDVLKKIGTVAKELNISVNAIRFWEKKINILRPIKKPNGTRYFSHNQLLLLKEIKYLLYEKKYSIAGVNLFFKEKNKTSPNLEEKKLVNEIRDLIDDIKSQI